MLDLNGVSMLRPLELLHFGVRVFGYGPVLDLIVWRGEPLRRPLAHYSWRHVGVDIGIFEGYLQWF